MGREARIRWSNIVSKLPHRRGEPDDELGVGVGAGGQRGAGGADPKAERRVCLQRLDGSTIDRPKFVVLDMVRVCHGGAGEERDRRARIFPVVANIEAKGLVLQDRGNA